MAVLWTFRAPALCRHVPREFMRHAVLHLTLIIPATAYNKRNYVGRYSRYMLRHVHQSLQARMDQRGTRSPLALLIESIEEVLGVFEGRQLFAGVGPKPFHRDPRYRWSTPGFRPETACHHDITLLQSQLAGLRELSAGLDRW